MFDPLSVGNHGQKRTLISSLKERIEIKKKKKRLKIIKITPKQISTNKAPETLEEVFYIRETFIDTVLRHEIENGIKNSES